MLLDLMEPILLEVLHAVPVRELLPCLAACRALAQANENPLLWFRVYCASCRGHFEPPPSFEELVAGDFRELPLKLELFDWAKLCRHRASLAPATPLQQHLTGRLQVSAQAACAGMIDVEHSAGGGWMGSQCAAVLRRRLSPLPAARPIAYVELYVRGGASVGLVSSASYSQRSHIGWKEGSLGYHGDEGSIYAGSGESSAFGPTFGLDPEQVVPNDSGQADRKVDVIGVGIDFGPGGPDTVEGAREGAKEGSVVFFTKNGVYIGSVPRDEPEMQYFAFALHRQGDRASLNTGANRFLFDIEEFSQVPRLDV